MANKRTRKKIATKKKRSLLLIEKVVSTKKEARHLKGKELNKTYKRTSQKVNNRERAREISAEAKRWGLSPSKFNSWKKLNPEIDRIKKEMAKEQKKAEKRKKDASRFNGNKLYIHWTDTQGFSQVEFDRQLDEVDHIYRTHGENGLLEHIRKYVHERFGIPSGVVSDPDIVDSKSSIDLKEYYYADGWREAYSGICAYWLPLMKLMAVMMTCLYAGEVKLQFLLDLSQAVEYFNPKFARWISDIARTQKSLSEIKKK